MKKAEDFFANGEEGRASEIVKKILEKKKDYVPARYLRARLLAKQGQYLLAISELNSVLQLPEYSRYVNELEIHYTLAELYNATQQYSKEIDEYKAILSFNPEDLNANHRIGHSYYRQGKFKETRDTLLKAVTIDPSLSDCYLPLGISCYQLSDYENAEKYLLKALEIRQQTRDGHYYLGLLYKGKKDYDNAMRMFQTAQKDSALYRDSLYQIGMIYYVNDHYEKTIETLEQGLNSLKAREEESLAYRYLLAEAYEMNNQLREAIHHWEIIQTERPSYRDTQTKLDDYNAIFQNVHLETVFTSSLQDLQPLISEIIARLNFNVISKNYISSNQMTFKAYNIKRINEPPALIYFNRTTREIDETKIIEFTNLISQEKCKTGIYITTSRYTLKAQAIAASKMIEMLDKDYLIRIISKIRGKGISKN